MKNLLATLLLVLSTTSFGQGPEVRLNIDHITGPRLLSEVGTMQAAEAAYPHTFGWARQKGWTNAEIMSLSVAEAAWHNAFWSGENGNYSSPNPGHAINITVPAGKFPVTFPLPFAQGVYKGAGSRFHDSNGTHSYGGTEWYVDHPAWKTSHSTDRIIMRSANWGVDGGYGAWVHHYIIEGFHFNGNRRTPWMPSDTAESAGVGAWDSGEASEIRNCYFADFEKDGILLVRGTPVLITACSMFTTSRYGIAIVGGGSVTCVGISGDESGIALIGSIGGYGRPGSARLAVFGAKQETSTSAEFRPWKGSGFLHAEDWIRASIHGVSYAASWTQPYSFISVKPTTNTSNITVTGTLFFGNAPKVLLYDEARNLEYGFLGDAWNNEVGDFSWSQSQGLKATWVTVPTAQRTGAAGRLQHVGQDGASSWETAQIYDPTGGTVAPPPPPCTYTTGNWSAWGPCINGRQERSRTVVPSPPECVGTAPSGVETRACDVQPPPPTAGELPLKPEDVVVVVNANDPQSRAIADAYKATWGVTREVVMNLGTGQSIGTTAFNTERSKLANVQAQALALCFTVPTRVNEVNGITSAMTYGYSTRYTTTASGYGRPSAPIKRAVLVNSISIIQNGRSATGTKPRGTIYTVLANDGGGTAPRGDARAPQVVGAAGDRIRALLPSGVNLVVQDNRQGCAGECGGNELTGKSDVLAYFGSMYKISQWHTNTVLPGAYCDNLTSTSGNLPSGQGQTPITAFAPSFSSGTVTEPWMTNSTTTARQFTRIDTFSVAYFGQGQSYAQAAYRAVERPYRLLIVGDPLCAPYADVTPTAPGPVDPPPVDPPPVDPPPTGGAIGSWSFGSYTPTTIPGMTLQSGSATVGGGKLSTTATYTYWSLDAKGVRTVTLVDFTPSALNYQYLLTTSNGKGLILLPDGSVQDNAGGGDVQVLQPGALRVGSSYSGTLTLPTARDYTGFGASPGAGNAWQGSLGGMELR